MKRGFLGSLKKESADSRTIRQDPIQGLPHQDPRNHIEKLEDLVSRSKQNEVSEYHMLCKIFPYSIQMVQSTATRIFNQLG
ncbi:hypothetical protein F2Q69_00059150 [Brassica cretica]|uniref:Uncharacterized protein n=1 Tax=Brassica cretica TaxID=69181 RepID=A0A8S9RFY7_BRACR|nr:hypothetical protein F2Q69_00059150 [Brassica cretica]